MWPLPPPPRATCPPLPPPPRRTRVTRLPLSSEEALRPLSTCAWADCCDTGENRRAPSATTGTANRALLIISSSLMLHCTSTVLNASHHWSSIVMRTGACHGGENGHASLRLSCQWRGS